MNICIYTQNENIVEHAKDGKMRHTEKTKQKISKSLTGKKHSKSTRLKMSKSHKGHITTEKTKKKISKANKGKIPSKLCIENSIKARRTPELRIKASLSHTGEKVFTGFKTTQKIKIRKSNKYKEWRTAVYMRDDYKCQITGESLHNLVAHHIQNFDSNLKLRFDVNNGFTMQDYIHNLFHKIYGFKDNNIGQIMEFKKVINYE